MYPKYSWVANRIEPSEMYKLYLLKKAVNKPITQLVKEAVQHYVNRNIKLIEGAKNERKRNSL